MLCFDCQVFFVFFFLVYWSMVDLQCFYLLLYSKVIQLYTYIYLLFSLFFQILFPYRSLQSIEQSSLCYTAVHYWLSVLYIAVCICQSQSPNLSFLAALLPYNQRFVFYICNSISFVDKYICTIFLQISNINNIILCLCLTLFIQHNNPCCCKQHYFILSMAMSYSIIYIPHIFFIHSSVDGHLGYFHDLAIVNSGAKNTRGHVLNYVLLQIYDQE